jgi:amino acid transporter
VAIGCLALLALILGLPLTYLYEGTRTFGYLGGPAGLSGVLVYLTVNIAVIRAFRTEFRQEFRLWRHLVIPAAATLLLFALRGILRPPCLHTDGSTALHGPRMALPRLHRRRIPAYLATPQPS